MGDWQLTDAQARKLREYLLRGDFLMLDDFWGTEEWLRFEESMQRVFPGRPIGRIMVAVSFNSDVGDSWEWADDPNYPEKYSALGIRIGVNYVVSAMTH